jgi:hypothetical protein
MEFVTRRIKELTFPFPAIHPRFRNVSKDTVQSPTIRPGDQTTSPVALDGPSLEEPEAKIGKQWGGGNQAPSILLSDRLEATDDEAIHAALQA